MESGLWSFASYAPASGRPRQCGSGVAALFEEARAGARTSSAACPAFVAAARWVEARPCLSQGPPATSGRPDVRPRRPNRYSPTPSFFFSPATLAAAVRICRMRSSVIATIRLSGASPSASRSRGFPGAPGRGWCGGRAYRRASRNRPCPPCQRRAACCTSSATRAPVP